jgi:hypothetical protein
MAAVIITENPLSLAFTKETEWWWKAGFAGLAAIGFASQMQPPPSLPITETDPQEAAVEQAREEMAAKYREILESLNTTNLSPVTTEGGGLEQLATVNAGIEIREKVEEQIKDPSHPNYRQDVQTALMRSLLTNATQLALAAEVDDITTKKGGEKGIVVSYFSTEENKQKSLVLPESMLQIIALSYTEALVSQAQIGQVVEQETAIETQKLIQNINNFADSNLVVQAELGKEETTAQLHDLKQQIKQEAMMYVSPDGSVVNEDN